MTTFLRTDTPPDIQRPPSRLEVPESPPENEIPIPETQPLSADPLNHSIAAATSCLLQHHHKDGYWCAELQGDSILESEYILLKFILGQESDRDLPLIANYLRLLQQPDGGFNMYPGGAADISGTVKGYFALKLMGDSPDAPHMQRCKNLILKMGGAEKANSFSKFYLAALGQISYDACPSIPPEIALLPKFLYFNLYTVSAWSRTMILPLALVVTLRPTRHLAPEMSIKDLYVDYEAANSPVGRLMSLPKSWRQMFYQMDAALKKFEKSSVTPLRPLAIKAAEKWILQHMANSEGLGAIFPPMVYVLIVFRALGYPDDHPTVRQAHQHLKDLFIRDNGPAANTSTHSHNYDHNLNRNLALTPLPTLTPHLNPTPSQNSDLPPSSNESSITFTSHPPTPLPTIRIQPCFSPIWDTGIALHALAEAGISPDHPAAQQTTQWLLAKECRHSSDWAKNAPGVEPSGWYFEFLNPHYPDVDDTAMVSMALKRAGGHRAQPAVKRAVNWLLAMQNDDGGWAAFDRTRNRPLLEHVPFADHNAIQDPSCPDIAGRVLECLGHCGITTTHPNVHKAIDFIRETQDKDGCWFGRWGVNYVYGTWQTLTGLRSVGQRMDASWIQKSADWLRSVQKPDGSFGESCDTYEDPTLKGQGESTPSQTAWGAMALMAIQGKKSKSDPHIQKAINYLIQTQLDTGSWAESHYTGTGFPRVFYLKYHLYRLYFPLTALARYRRLCS